MKRELCWLALLLAAMLAALLPTGHDGVSWPAGRYTHRGTSFNNIICWALLATLAAWIIVDIVQRLRARS